MNEREKSQINANMHRQNMVEKKYRHFKGGIYRVVDIAVHSENAEMLVIYKSVDDESKVWARPLEMFISEVDHLKYPEVKQKYRFEEISE